MKIFIIIIVILFVIIFFFRPVCVQISSEALENFNVPIGERADRDFYVKVFQQKDNEWYQCKTYLSRLFFF